jgi:tRNA(adenine34) deaminase
LDNITAKGIERDEDYMRAALAEASAAEEAGEVPVGAVLSIEGEVKGRGHNLVISSSDPTAHAEMVAIRDAARHIGNYRLVGATLYATIEPCAMCAGAIVHARISRLVIGARDPRAGAVLSHFGVCTTDFLNHRLIVEEGILESDCRSMIQSFFRNRREQE